MWQDDDKITLVGGFLFKMLLTTKLRNKNDETRDVLNISRRPSGELLFIRPRNFFAQTEQVVVVVERATSLLP